VQAWQEMIKKREREYSASLNWTDDFIFETQILARKSYLFNRSLGKKV